MLFKLNRNDESQSIYNIHPKNILFHQKEVWSEGLKKKHEGVFISMHGLKSLSLSTSELCI